MAKLPSTLSRFEKKAVSLFESRKILGVVFCRGAYQYEVEDEGKVFYPFLNVSEKGDLKEGFCTCAESELHGYCSHIATSYLALFISDDPLHVLYEKSIWKFLCYELSKKVVKIQRNGARWEGISKSKKVLFWIELEDAEVWLNRKPTEEELSIKLFHLTEEEIAFRSQGKITPELNYELSYWSDLAKGLVAQEDCALVWEGDEHDLPSSLKVTGKDLSNFFSVFFGSKLFAKKFTSWFYLPKSIWEEFIPRLKSTRTKFNVYEKPPLKMEAWEYFVEGIKIPTSLNSLENKKGIQVGGWVYVENDGFYLEPKIKKNWIDAVEVPSFLLSVLDVSEFKDCQANYHLAIGDDQSIEIELFAKSPGDIKNAYLPFVLLQDNSFIRLNQLHFDSVKKKIPKDEVPDFIQKNRTWLHQIPGFQIHIGHFESHLTYFFNDRKDLCFDAELKFPEVFEEKIHFDEWIYIRGFGFYLKNNSGCRLPLYPGLRVKKEEISDFIHEHKQDLELVHQFFSTLPVVKKLGLKLSIDDSQQIVINPKLELVSDVQLSDIEFYGDFVYLIGKGFSSIPLGSLIPEKYRKQTTIESSFEAAFLTYELEPLRPFILEIDPRLNIPQRLQLKIRRIQKDRKKISGEWLFDIIYESDQGSLDLPTLHSALHEKKRYLFTQAGLISLDDLRFQWLKALPKKRIDRKKGMIRIQMLDWIRMNIFEEISKPQGDSPEAKEVKELLEEVESKQANRIINTSVLKSSLRPYQETGLQWLWFLYCHGLSGLLCDDMGLGKTHQAMALLSTVVSEDSARCNKYLVVCPTSVIYHWQMQLQTYLPNLRVYSYYGGERDLTDFEENYDLILTSYGILRTGKNELRALGFEVAIFDEIQVAKNHLSQTNRSLQLIRSKMKLGLTGTPIENKIREIKSLLDVVLPGYLPQEALFKEWFIRPIEKLQDQEKKTLLMKMIRPFVLRRKKSEVLLDLPEKIETISYCDLSDLQRQLYQETLLSFRSGLWKDLQEKSKPVSFVHIFSVLSRLKRICDHPSLVLDDRKGKDLQSGKWDLFIEILTEARESGQKVVVFSQYLEMLQLIEQYLKKKSIGFASIKGTTKDRAHQIKMFREDSRCEVFTGSLLAAGVGIDLTGASVVVHYDRWWNPAKENQATDRVHRMGQSRGVQVFKLVSKNTLEEHIHDLIERKKGLLEEVIGSEDAGVLRVLSREEIIEVFEKIFKQSF